MKEWRERGTEKLSRDYGKKRKKRGEKWQIRRKKGQKRRTWNRA